MSLSASESRRRRLSRTSSAERSAQAVDRDRVKWTREASDKCHLPGEREQSDRRTAAQACRSWLFLTARQVYFDRFG